MNCSCRIKMMESHRKGSEEKREDGKERRGVEIKGKGRGEETLMLNVEYEKVCDSY